MDNRKIILAFYLVSSMVLWLLSRSGIQYFYLTFYQIRRLQGIAFIREALPVVLAAGCFLFLFRNAKVNTLLEEVVSELKKVTWPSRDEVVRSTTVVLVCITFASLVLAAFDLLWGKVIGFFLKG